MSGIEYTQCLTPCDQGFDTFCNFAEYTQRGLEYCVRTSFKMELVASF